MKLVKIKPGLLTHQLSPPCTPILYLSRRYYLMNGKIDRVIWEDVEMKYVLIDPEEENENG